MQDVETKLEPKFKKVFPGFRSKPKTIAAATASLQQNIDDLKHVHESREQDAQRKAQTIEKLEKERADDQREATGAKKLADKLEKFLFGDLDEL